MFFYVDDVISMAASLLGLPEVRLPTLFLQCGRVFGYMYVAFISIHVAHTCFWMLRCLLLKLNCILTVITMPRISRAVVCDRVC